MKTLEHPTTLDVMTTLFAAANAHDANAIAQLVNRDYVGESDCFPEPIHGRAAYQAAVQGFWTAFPDLHYQVEQMIASGNTVVTRLRLTGTHRGDFAGHAATGRKFMLRICHVDELEEGLITRAWFCWDFGTVMRQVGLA